LAKFLASGAKRRPAGNSHLAEEWNGVAVEVPARAEGLVDKFVERRTALAWAAVRTLSELGYARTSLREIAQNCDESHGVLHYYFKDKADLITCCVRLYKAHCIERYDEAATQATTASALIDGFVERLSASIREDAHLHRLWYDLRAQSLFEPVFRPDVAEIDKSLEEMVWRVVVRRAELSHEPPALPSALCYALVDGIFQQCLIKHVGGDATAIAAMQQQVRALFARL
jgi:AcrR family transcriptional regulator